MTEEERKCLEERKYWCFLLSSIVTFCVSMLLVVSWRIITHLFCQRRDKNDTEDPAPDEGVHFESTTECTAVKLTYFQR